MRELIVVVGPPGTGLVERGRFGDAVVSSEGIRRALFGGCTEGLVEEIVDRIVARALVELIDSDVGTVCVEGPTATRRERSILVEAGRLAGRRVIARVASDGSIDARYEEYRRLLGVLAAGEPLSRERFAAAVARIERVEGDEGFSAVETIAPPSGEADAGASPKRKRVERKNPIPLFAG